MSDLAIRFQEAQEAHAARGYAPTAIDVSYGDLEAIARDFNITVSTTVKLYIDWKKSA